MHYNNDSSGKAVKVLCGNKAATRATTEYPDVSCKKCLSILAAQEQESANHVYNYALDFLESKNP